MLCKNQEREDLDQLERMALEFWSSMEVWVGQVNKISSVILSSFIARLGTRLALSSSSKSECDEE